MFSSFELTEKQQARRLAQRARKLAWEKRRRQQQELQKAVIIPPRDLNERQKKWISKNCQPKIYRFRKTKRKFSRWAKQGPMALADWKKFFKWADKNAEAKQKPKPHCKPKDLSAQKKKKKRNVTPEEVWEHIDQLATPKLPREKYEYADPIVYPYSPKIHYRRPAKRDRGRPFMPPKVPKVFQHIELEIDFWSTLRFPIRRAALQYAAPKNILDLAKPRIMPPFEPHCPIPPKPVEYVAPRKRMTKSQWEKHKNRLQFLAAPKKCQINIICTKILDFRLE